MRQKGLVAGTALLMLLTGSCARKRVQAPPPPKPVEQNVFVLLPEPDGKPSSIVVKNAAGTQTLDQPYLAVKISRLYAAPSAPFTIDKAEVQQLFGATLNALPEEEMQFILYFDEGKDVLVPESEAQLGAIVKAIADRHSTAISVTGHTDTTGSSALNYQLGLKRAQKVAGILIAKGVSPNEVFVESHGDADLLVKTPRGVAEQRNRRVEVIVR
jgi:outer membrane protein OmpA-like peptidoglycan-associated protein